MAESSKPISAIEVFFSYSHIELDAGNGEYYYLRYSLRRLEFDFDYEGDFEPGNLPYTRESVRARESDLARAIELDPSIAEALRDRQRASNLGFEEPRIRSIANFNWEEFLSNPPKPMEIKEPWRLKCLRD
jgi:hypothetical protein